MKLVGSRLQVFKGTATRTSGGLKKKDLATNRSGKIVSKRKQMLAKQKSNLKSLLVDRGKPPKAPKPKAKKAPAPAPEPTRRSKRVRKKTKRYGFS